MITGKPIRIVSMGTYLPKKIMSSEIEDRYNIPRGWSEKYSGVSSRHHVTHESNGFMGARAAERALEKAKMTLKDIDLLISAGGSFDYIIPNQASSIKNEMKNGRDFHFPAIDLDSTCLSFVAALDFASRMLAKDSYRTIMIVSSEIASKGLNPDNWETTTLFGDAAAAAIVTLDENSESLYIKGDQKTYSEGTFYAMIEGGGLVNYVKENPYDQELYSFKMEGRKLLKMAKRIIPSYIESFFSDLPMKLEDSSIVISHSASKMGVHIFEQMYSFKPNQLKHSLKMKGNCIAASIPLTLAECIDNEEIKRGDTCFLIGTSAGFSIGSLLFKY